MAELASGAVSSLLGLLQKEARLLGRVGSDVEFIREEMESMNSFLEHLAKTGHLAGGHDKQVRTWMKQVRDLAHDCSNCVDGYLQSGDLAVHLARGGFRRRYLWWTYWLVQKMVAQHRAAMRLRELRDRVSDVGKRRLRYGVEVPGRASTSTSTALPASSSSSMKTAAPVVAAEEEDEEEEDGIRNQEEESAAAAVGGSPDPRRRALEPRTLQDYCAEKLVSWFSSSSSSSKRGKSIPSVAIVAPAKVDSGVVVQEALALVSSLFDERVFINLSALHLSWDLPLLPREILYYILRECHQQQAEAGRGTAGAGKAVDIRKVFCEKRSMCSEIRAKVSEMGVYGKIQRIKSKIGEADTKIAGGVIKSDKTDEGDSTNTSRLKSPAVAVGIPSDHSKPLLVLHEALWLTLGEEGPEPNMIGRSSEEIIPETANFLQQLMMWDDDEAQAPNNNTPLICLDATQYEDILRKVFLHKQDQETSSAMQQQQEASSEEDHIKEILHNHRIALDIIRELLSRPQLPQAVNSVEERAKGILQVGQDQGIIVTDPPVITEKMDERSSSSAVPETEEKVQEIMSEINRQLLIKGIVDKITMLKDRKTLIGIIDDGDYISDWEDIRNALSLLSCGDGSAVTVITKNNQKAKDFCCPPGEPITYSLVGMYHDIVLKVTSPRGTEAEGQGGAGNNNSQIFHDILAKCDPDESSMRMFAHAMYSNPNRNDEDLTRLNGALHLQAVSVNSVATNAKMIFKFSYRDLPREHKTCLLYLAIFPEGYNIKRSKLIERWAIEGLITKEDWHTVMRHAKRCFNALIDRWIVIPGDLSASGKVKSCLVGSPVHGFITKIASKEQVLDARLSSLRARHFSTSSGLQLRASDTIDKFVQNLPNYSRQLRLLKLLDLEGCQCLDKNHLKDICSMILRLRYLSLRETNVADLPTEINNLHELEVLDIRQTNVRVSATRVILLLKLRRLLAGRIDPSTTAHDLGAPDRNDKSVCLSVNIPRRINKMENMEVLSNVKAYSRGGAELKEIRHLWQLSKLGVVVNDNKAHLENLLWAISDLKECLRSLSITISETTSADTTTTRRDDGTDSEDLLRHDLYLHLIQPPKVLESLSIDGFTNLVRLLPLFFKGSEELAKVTLSRIMLEKRNLMHIATLPKLRCIRLRYNAYKDNTLTFEEQYFPHLKYFLAEWLSGTDVISFKDNAALELEKIVLIRTKIKHLRGVGALPNLKELELRHNEDLILLPKEDATSGEPLIPEDAAAAACVDPKPIITASAQSSVTDSSTLTFRKGEFTRLNYFLLEGSGMQTNITFESGATPELEKIVLSYTNIGHLHGVGGLAKLREIELKADRTLSSFADANHITKVTLSETRLKKNDIQILARKPKLCWLLLLENSYDDNSLKFEKAEFPELKHLTVKCSMISNISFDKESASKLEKIIWFFTDITSLSGIGLLPELKEIEFNGGFVPRAVRKDIHTHIKKPVLKHNKLQHQENKEK